MIDFRNVYFVKSAPSASQRPDGLFDILFVGRSNVGKSSLINALCSRKDLAFTSSKPGHTKLLNYYNVDNKFYLVDAPGYGYVSRGPKDAFSEMMEGYFATSKPRLVIFLFDSRRIPQDDDVSFMGFLQTKQIPLLLVVTKVDKVNQSGKALIQKNMQPFSNVIPNLNYLLISVKNKDSIVALKAKISQMI